MQLGEKFLVAALLVRIPPAGDLWRFRSASTGLTMKKKTDAAIATNWMRFVMKAP